MRVDECRRVDDEPIDDAPIRVFGAVLLDLLRSYAAVRLRSAAALVLGGVPATKNESNRRCWERWFRLFKYG